MKFIHLSVACSASFTPSDSLLWDDCCRNLNGESSYCKTWQTPSVCLGGDQPCGLSGNLTDLNCFPNASNQTYLPECDEYCDRLGIPGVNSTICAYWQPKPVCGSTNVSCSSPTCSLGVSLANRCDQFCDLVSGADSQCSSLTASATCDNSLIGCPTSTCTSPITLCDNYCFRLNGAGSFCQPSVNGSSRVCAKGGQSCSFRDCSGMSGFL